ncbi:high mobility group box domain-containing protein [Streptomyces sp. AV19]|nr:high mobility group box domain-containing protein [Streptomyces sp. AV19]
MKDKDAPKRPQSAYMIFANENRSRVKAANPTMRFGEIGNQLGIEWQRLPLAEKKPYEEKAAKDKERYEQQMEAYKKDKGARQEG